MRGPAESNTAIARILAVGIAAGGCGAQERAPSPQVEAAPAPEIASDNEAAEVLRICYECQEALLGDIRIARGFELAIAKAAKCITTMDRTGDRCQLLPVGYIVNEMEIDECSAISADVVAQARCLDSKIKIEPDIDRVDDQFLVTSSSRCERRNEQTVLDYLGKVCIPAFQKGKERLEKLRELFGRLNYQEIELGRAVRAKNNAAKSRQVAEQMEKEARAKAQTEAEKAEKRRRLEEMRKTLQSD